jgi:hypothetical protein
MNYSWSGTDENEWPGFNRHRNYKVRVRGTIYLWGSALVEQDTTFPTPPVLHIRNDQFGEEITFGTQVAAGTQTTIGNLKPGECYSIPIQEISGVFVTCELESTVHCVIADH